MKILIKNVILVDQSSVLNGGLVHILVEDGIILDLGTSKFQADREIDFEGCCLSAGWFDMRTSICDPGLENKESIRSVTIAASRGGFTGISSLPNTKPIVQSKDTVSYILTTSKEELVDIYPYGAVTTDLKGEELTEMMDLTTAGVVAFTDAIEPVWHAGVLIRALQYVKPFGGLIIQHCEEKKLTQYGQMNEGVTSTYLGLKGMPALAEELMLQRDIELVKYTGGRIHFSRISTAGSVAMIREAKAAGLEVTCDVAVPNLIWTETELVDFDSNFKLNPPLRTQDDKDSLWKGLADGTIDVIVTDHCPQDEESKNLEFNLADFGMIQLETAFALLNSAKPKEFTIATLIEKITKNPRAILKLPQVTIEVGNEANFTIFNPNLRWVYDLKTKRSKSKNSPMIGREMIGKVVAVANNQQFETFV